MARQALTETEWRAKAERHHLPTMEAALRSLRRSGATSAYDADEHREAARVLEAGGCYIRRGLERGFSL